MLARRLSNAELDYTIRDLTGVDIRPTKEFPVDPANEAGFDNSGESLAMSPALLKKYLAAARRVADHLVFKPAGFDFAPEPAVTETDRDKYCVRRIIEFYKRHRVDYADYFLAAWRFEHRAALGKPKASLHEFATEAGLSNKYLATVVERARRSLAGAGPLGELQALWRKLPSDVQQADEARRDANRCAIWSSGCARARARGRRDATGASPPAASHSSSGGPAACLGADASPATNRPHATSRSSAGSSPMRSSFPTDHPTSTSKGADRDGRFRPAST